MSLETVSKVLTEHLSVAHSDRLMAKVDESLLVRRMYKMLLWGIIAVIFGIALLAIGKNNGLITLPGLLIALVGMLLAAYGVLSPIKTMALPSRQQPQSKALKQPESELYLKCFRLVLLLSRLSYAVAEHAGRTARQRTFRQCCAADARDDGISR